MGVHKSLDIDIQDLQEAVRVTRNYHLNSPMRDVGSEEAQLGQRNELCTRLLRSGWIPPTYAHAMKARLLEGEPARALALLADVLNVDLELVGDQEAAA